MDNSDRREARFLRREARKQAEAEAIKAKVDSLQAAVTDWKTSVDVYGNPTIPHLEAVAVAQSIKSRVASLEDYRARLTGHELITISEATAWLEAAEPTTKLLRFHDAVRVDLPATLQRSLDDSVKRLATFTEKLAHPDNCPLHTVSWGLDDLIVHAAWIKVCREVLAYLNSPRAAEATDADVVETVRKHLRNDISRKSRDARIGQGDLCERFVTSVQTRILEGISELSPKMPWIMIH
jgi:hypothetical protein